MYIPINQAIATMNPKLLIPLLTGFFFCSLGCEKESDGNSTNGGGSTLEDCDITFTIIPNIYPSGSGTISFNDGEYCHGDSVLCTAIPNENFEFVQWDDSYSVPTSPDGTSAYFHIYESWDESTQDWIPGPTVAAIFSLIDTCENYTVSTSVFPEGTGVVNYDDGLYCFGDSVLCTAVPSLNYEFLEWSGFGNLSPHSPPGNSAYFYVYDDEHIVASFRAIDTSFISSSINLIGGFPCDPDNYPSCSTSITDLAINIRCNPGSDIGPAIGFTNLNGFETGMTYEISEGLNVNIDPDVSVLYDEYSVDWLLWNEDLGSITVNFINQDTKTVEITLNNVLLKNNDEQYVTFFGSIHAQGL